MTSKMNIEQYHVEEIFPYENNPRINDGAVDKIAKSIERFGWTQPIVVDENRVIIAGHTRYKAAKKLGIEMIPVYMAVGLKPDDVKALRIADNRLAEESSWDFNLLSIELQDLKSLDFDLDLTGFNEAEIADIFKEDDISNTSEEDEIQNLDYKSTSTRGDIWLLGKHRLMCGDSTDPLHVEKLYNNNNPVLMVTDPPYGVNYEPEWRVKIHDDKKDASSLGKVQNDNIVDWAEAYQLFTGNIVYIWHADKFTDIIAKNIKDCDFEIVTQIIWAKQHFCISRGDYHYQHEPCWYAVRKKCKHNWQGARDQSTLWEISNSKVSQECDEKTEHSTQKPIECMLRPILNNSKKGDYVYDPFGGSGTTLIAAEKSGRTCLMMEIDPRYIDLIIKRWEKTSGKKAIHEETSLQFEEIERKRNI